MDNWQNNKNKALTNLNGQQRNNKTKHPQARSQIKTRWQKI